MIGNVVGALPDVQPGRRQPSGEDGEDGVGVAVRLGSGGCRHSQGRPYPFRRSTGILPRVALEYGQIWWAAASSSSACTVLTPGKCAVIVALSAKLVSSG